jgi:hypothetical protein
MPENKTSSADASIEEYIATGARNWQRADCPELIALQEMITRYPPGMLGPGIVGFGSRRHTYESGRTGEAPMAGFAALGRQLVVSLLPEVERQQALLEKPGNHRMGKSCLYFKQLADLDESVLRRLVVNSVAEVGWHDG